MISSGTSRRVPIGAVPLLGGAALLPSASSATALVRRNRRQLAHGVAAGDVGLGSGVLWARADRPSRLWA